jgi:hypothetical protein
MYLKISVQVSWSPSNSPPSQLHVVLRRSQCQLPEPLWPPVPWKLCFKCPCEYMSPGGLYPTPSRIDCGQRLEFTPRVRQLTKDTKHNRFQNILESGKWAKLLCLAKTCSPFGNFWISGVWWVSDRLYYKWPQCLWFLVSVDPHSPFLVWSPVCLPAHWLPWSLTHHPLTQQIFINCALHSKIRHESCFKIMVMTSMLVTKYLFKSLNFILHFSYS